MRARSSPYFWWAFFLMGALLLTSVERTLATSRPLSPLAQATVCWGTIITQWTFTGNLLTPSFGAGTFQTAGVTGPTFVSFGSTSPAVSYSNWSTSSSADPGKYLEFSINISGRTNIRLTFDASRSSTGPANFDLWYSVDGGTFTPFDSPRYLTTDELFYLFDFSALPDFAGASNLTVRLFGYQAGGASGTWRIDNVTFSGDCINQDPTPTPSTPRSVIISEVAWMGTLASPNHEWIELYNPTSMPIDLTGWTLRAADNTPLIELSGNIPANGYFLLGNNQVFSNLTLNLQYSGSLENSGGSLILSDAYGYIVDTANGDGGIWPGGNASTRCTMERLGTEEDADNVWYTSTTLSPVQDAAGQPICGTPAGGNSPTPTPTVTSSPTLTFTPTITSSPTLTFTPTSTTTPVPPRSVVISEVAWMGTTASGNHEWIELYNTTTVAIDLNGWRLEAADGSPSVHLTGIIPAGEFFLLERSTDDVISNIPADLIYSGALSNDGERLFLYDAAGNIVDTANANGGPWPAGNASTFGSMERTGPLILNDSDTAWLTHTGAAPRNGIDANGNPIRGTPKRPNWAFTVTATPSPTMTPTRTATPLPTPVPFKSVVISEVAWMGTAASSSHEWIELYNTTFQPISLDGWRLVSFRWSGTQFVKNLDIALQGVIQPRTSNALNDPSGYFLLVADSNVVRFPGTNITYDQVYSGSLYNTGEILLLCSTYHVQIAHNCDINHKTEVVDFVNGRLSSSGTVRPWPAGSSSTYGSMERKILQSDEDYAYYTHTGNFPRFGVDANGNPIKGTPKHPNWAFTVTATPSRTPTPTRTPTRSPVLVAPVLVLNEILSRPGSDWNVDGKVDVLDEFIEVINAGTINVTLSNYRIDTGPGSTAFTLPNATLKPGERMVFYGSQSGIRLRDSGGMVRLVKTSNGSVVDAVTHPIARTLDSSVCRYTDGYGSWLYTCFPTPGLPNSLTGSLLPVPVSGPPICTLPDSTPREFVQAECEEVGGGIWNWSYWDAFPGEGSERWVITEREKWQAVYR